MLTRQRCLMVSLVATLTAIGVLRLLAACWSPTDGVVDLCLVALALATGWAWLATTAAVVEVWRGRTPARRTLIRRLVLLCCGVALAAPMPGAVAGAVADDQGLAGLPMPDRAVGAAHHRTHQPVPQPAGQPVATPRTVVVQAGDCLWHLAAQDLPSGATDEQIAARSRAIYLLNRTLIGADPDLIQPGQRLALPR